MLNCTLHSATKLLRCAVTAPRRDEWMLFVMAKSSVSNLLSPPVLRVSQQLLSVLGKPCHEARILPWNNIENGCCQKKKKVIINPPVVPNDFLCMNVFLLWNIKGDVLETYYTKM